MVTSVKSKSGGADTKKSVLSIGRRSALVICALIVLVAGVMGAVSYALGGTSPSPAMSTYGPTIHLLRYADSGSVTQLHLTAYIQSPDQPGNKQFTVAKPSRDCKDGSISKTRVSITVGPRDAVYSPPNGTKCKFMYGNYIIQSADWSSAGTALPGYWKADIIFQTSCTGSKCDDADFGVDKDGTDNERLYTFTVKATDSDVILATNQNSSQTSYGIVGDAGDGAPPPHQVQYTIPFATPCSDVAGSHPVSVGFWDPDSVKYGKTKIWIEQRNRGSNDPWTIITTGITPTRNPDKDYNASKQTGISYQRNSDGTYDVSGASNTRIQLGFTMMGTQEYQFQIKNTNSTSSNNVYSFSWPEDTIYAGINCASLPNPNKSPYLKVYGGDVEAGIGPTSGSCSTDNSAQIVSFNADSGSYAGAGGQFGVQAMNVIRGFVSAQGNTASGSGPPVGSGLSFANTASLVGSGLYGGKFGGTTACPDYTRSVSGATVRSSYDTGGTVSVGPSTTPTVVYVKGGDAYIKDNIIYTTGDSGGYNLNNVPAYRLVVSGGNIYIGSGVTTLSGVYVAQPDATGTGGNIYTCSKTSGAGMVSYKPATDPGFFAACNHQLKIYGSFVAQHVYFLRTYGSMEQAVSDKNYYSSSANNSAEQFVYGPEEWLGQIDGGVGNSVDSIVSLPPTVTGN